MEEKKADEKPLQQAPPPCSAENLAKPMPGMLAKQPAKVRKKKKHSSD